MDEPFKVIFGLFLIASAFILWLARNFLARAGVEGFDWLPETSKLRNHDFQIRLCAVAFSTLAVVGLAIILLEGIDAI